VPDVDLIAQKDLFKIYIPEEESIFYSTDNTLYQFNYPVLKYPEKIKSLNLNKQKEYEGILTGIKGQYWIFEDNTVWNLRGHEGFYVILTI